MEMTPEQFTWWKKGMEHAALISNEEFNRRKNINYDTAQAAAGMAEIIAHKINREIQFEEDRRKSIEKIINLTVHPSHGTLIIDVKGGRTCKFCGCGSLSNLMKPCEGDAQVRYDDSNDVTDERF